MSNFLSPLIVLKTPAARVWEVYVPFTYNYVTNISDIPITVPMGFLTDFATIPRPLWTVLPKDGLYTQACVLHDYLYTIKRFTRKEADDILLDAMKTLGVGLIVRTTIFSGVRAFGGFLYNTRQSAL